MRPTFELAGRRVRVEHSAEPRWGRLEGARSSSTTARASRRPRRTTSPRSSRPRSSPSTSPTAAVSRSTRRGSRRPSYFSKPPSTLNGHRGLIRRPAGARFLNYEGELAVVIGRRMKGVPVEDAISYVAGYACANDVGLHDFRHADRGSMLRVKGQDGFLPLGPELVPAAEFDPTDVHAAHVPERRGRAGGGRGRSPVPRRLPARRSLPPDHARAGRRDPDRHAGELAPDGARRRRRGRDLRPRPPLEHGRRVGRRPERPRRAAPRSRPTRSTSRSPIPEDEAERMVAS